MTKISTKCKPCYSLCGWSSLSLLMPYSGLDNAGLHFKLKSIYLCNVVLPQFIILWDSITKYRGCADSQCSGYRMAHRKTSTNWLIRTYWDRRRSLGAIALFCLVHSVRFPPDPLTSVHTSICYTHVNWVGFSFVLVTPHLSFHLLSFVYLPLTVPPGLYLYRL